MVTLLLLVCATYMWTFSSRTSCLWWITHLTQRQQSGCNNIPSFLKWTALIAHFFCEGWTRHDLHILVTAPLCCDWKAQAACAQSFALLQQATIEFTCHDHSITACSRHIYVVSSRPSHSWWIAHLSQRQWSGCNSTTFLQSLLSLLDQQKP